MSLRSLLACACLCSYGAVVQAQPDTRRELTPQDFAYGRNVELPAGDSPLVQVSLPVDVYRDSRSPDLQDVRVFNARGVEVPYAIERPRATQTSPDPVPLPLFPVAAAHGSPDAVGLAIEVSRSPEGQVLQLISKPLSDAAASLPITSYLLDARGLQHAITGFRFTFPASEDSVVLPVSIESSSDLTHWHELAVEGALLRLSHQGQRVDRDRVDIAPTRAEFYRVRPANHQPFAHGLTIAAAAAYPQAASRAPARARVLAKGRPVAARSGVFRFDLGGAVPVTHVSLELPEDNTVIEAELYAADKQEGPFERVAAARFYRFTSNGKTIAGPELIVPRLRSRYYELRVDTSRPGLGDGALRLVTEHAPDQLLFLRRGAAPFTVAYGRHAVVRQRFEAEDLIALLGRADRVAPLVATLAARSELGGIALLTAPKPAPPYKTYVLWFVLVAGVGLLALLAYRLVRAKPSGP